MFRSTSDIQDGAGHTLVTSYAVLRPDGRWSLMLVNKDQLNPQQVHIAFENEKGSSALYREVEVVTFGSEQYQWHSNMKGGIADPDGPEARSSVAAPKDGRFTLPKASVTVIRGKLGDALQRNSYLRRVADIPKRRTGLPQQFQTQLICRDVVAVEVMTPAVGDGPPEADA